MTIRNAMARLEALDKNARIAVVVTLAGFGICAAANAASTQDAAAQASLSPPVVRRLTPDQYRHIIADAFGPTIMLGGRFEPDLRDNGLLEVGASHVSVSSAGFEQYDAMARNVASQVVDEKHRDLLIPCKPASATAPDDACAKQFLAKAGRTLYRRPLSDAEVATHLKIADMATQTTHDFYLGLSLGLASILESPQFLFREGTVEPDSGRGGYRLNPYSKASQLSFFFWNAAPDTALLNAAAKGELNTKKGLATQVDRLLASPRVEDGLRAFFADMLQYDLYPTLAKDNAIYPKFSALVAEDSAEQTLKTLVDLLLVHNGDYRDIFTTKKTFLTEKLAAIYRVPVVNHVPNGAPERWEPYTFADSDPRAGIQMQVGFVALHSHPGRSSPTIRGKAVREILLCQHVPEPPGDVKFDIVQDTANPLYKTARDRVTAHRANPVCAGCHKIMDPIGLALENFDGGGEYRTTENGVPIDTSGELDGVKFADSTSLGKALHDNPAAPACLVNRLTSYALGRVPPKSQEAWLASLQKSFAAKGYRLPDLMRQIALSDEAYKVAAPQTTSADVPVKAGTSPAGQ